MLTLERLKSLSENLHLDDAGAAADQLLHKDFPDDLRKLVGPAAPALAEPDQWVNCFEEIVTGLARQKLWRGQERALKVHGLDDQDKREIVLQKCRMLLAAAGAVLAARHDQTLPRALPILWCGMTLVPAPPFPELDQAVSNDLPARVTACFEAVQTELKQRSLWNSRDVDQMRWALELLSGQSAGISMAQVRVLLVNPAEFGRLILNVRQSGSGRLIESPDQRKAFDDEWHCAMNESFNRRPEVLAKAEICWSLTSTGRFVGGASFQAAFEAALHLLSTNPRQIWDPSCAISATVEKDGRLGEVKGLFDRTNDRLGPKLEVAAANNVARVIVAKQQWDGLPVEDREFYQSLAKDTKVEIVPCDTITEAVAEATGLKRGLVAWLEAMSQLANRPRAYLGDRRLANLYVKPDVLKKAARRQDSADQNENGHLDVHETRSVNAATVAEEEQSDRAWSDDDYETRVSWDQECDNLQLAAIVARPGSGKSVLAEFTVRSQAQKSLDQLQIEGEQGKGTHDVTIPILLTFTEIAQAGGLKPAIQVKVDELLPGHSVEDRQVLGQFLIENVLQSTRCLLILDGLDEAEGKIEEKHYRRLEGSKTRVLILSRPYQYASLIRQTRLQIDVKHEYRLAPLSPKQQRQLVQNWFGPNDVTGKTLQDRLATSPFQQVASNGLLLSLACFAVEGTPELVGLGGPAKQSTLRRVDLYEHVLRELLTRGLLKEIKLKRKEAVTSLLRILPLVGWELYRDHPGGNEFTDTHFYKTFSEASKKSSDEWLEDRRELLHAAGVVLRVGRDGRMFLHRTFLEYLAAQHLATLEKLEHQKQQPGYLTEIDRYLWRWDETVKRDRWMPEAEEMLCFLAGSLDDPEPLLKKLVQLEVEKPDLGHSMLCLASRMLRDIDTQNKNIEPDLIHRITKTAADMVVGPWQVDPLILAHPAGEDELIRRLGTLRYDEQSRAIAALGYIGSPKAVECLQALLTDKHAGRENREEAVYAITAVGDASQVDLLFTLLSDDLTYNSKRIQFAAAAGIGMLGGGQVVARLASRLPELRALSGREDVSLPVAGIAQALGYFDDPRAISALMDLLEHKYGWRHKTVYIDNEAIRSLTRLNVSDAVIKFSSRLSVERNPTIVSTLCVSLGLLGDRRAVDALLNKWYSIRAMNDSLLPALCYAMSQLADQRMLLPVLERIHLAYDPRSSHYIAVLLNTLCGDEAVDMLERKWKEYDGGVNLIFVARPIAMTLGNLRNSRAVPFLIKNLSHSMSCVRVAAVNALSTLRASESIKNLVAMLDDEYPDVRSASASALGMLGEANAAEILYGLLSNEQEDLNVRMESGYALALFGDSRARGLLHLLRCDDVDCRCNTIVLLGQIESSWAVDGLIECLDDPDPFVRERAVEELSHLGDPRAVKPIVDQLEKYAWGGALRVLGRRVRCWRL